MLHMVYFCLLLCCFAHAEEYELSMKDYQWVNAMINTVRNYEQRAWHRWKIKEAAAATAVNQRLAPFIIGGDFYGPDYKKPTEGEKYIGIGRIYRPLEKPYTQIQ